MASIWGGDSPSVAWGENSWQSNTVTISLTGLSATSSVGDVDAFPEKGWGSDTWGVENWGESGLAVTLTGVSATASVGELVGFAEQGWGRDVWGEEPWGESFDPTVILTAPSGLTSSLGTPTVTTEINVGWGQDGWGVENWGQSGLTITVDVESSGVATTALPDTSWGAQGWGSSSDPGDVGVSWGGDFVLNVADVMGLTGVSATSSVGSITPIIDFT